jgi:NAD-dependent deacetylase sirtuin 2
LTRIYTQNIDGLDRQCTKLPADKISNVHGTISQAACEGCGTEIEFGEFCQNVETQIQDIYRHDHDHPNTNNGGGPNQSTPIPCASCGKALVKPKTVLFGRSLPEDFFSKSEQDLPTLDLLIVAGTSLVVSPANSLIYRVPDSTNRVVVNREPVGEALGISYSTTSSRSERDFFAQGDCDAVFLELIQELGWRDDLEEIKDLLPPKSQQLLLEQSQTKNN